MQIIQYPAPSNWEALCKRPSMPPERLEDTVRQIIHSVKVRGDSALHQFGKQFDGVKTAFIKTDVSRLSLDVDPALADAIRQAKLNIEKFHAAQKEAFQMVETTPGVSCWRKSTPIKSVGLYIPGGSAPLFSTLLMLAVPAKMAGCQNIVVCTPPQKDGSVNEVIAWTSRLLGLKTIYLTGGAQAVAAMAFGSESVPKVDKIFGPGNQYVTAAKQLVQQWGVAIDMPAGPSEVLVIADDSSYPEFVAADLLSQAEHGSDSQVVMATDSASFIDSVRKEIDTQIKKLPRLKTASKALENSLSILFNSLDEAVEFSNVYAPEHLIIATENSDRLAEKVTAAGSVFLGNWSCESAGDYASGTNHTLPTNGYARSYSGLSLDSFVKKITFQKLSAEGIKRLGPFIEKMAEAEQLQAHKHAVSLRLKKLENV